MTVKYDCRRGCNAEQKNWQRDAGKKIPEKIVHMGKLADQHQDGKGDQVDGGTTENRPFLLLFFLDCIFQVFLLILQHLGFGGQDIQLGRF